MKITLQCNFSNFWIAMLFWNIFCLFEFIKTVKILPNKYFCSKSYCYQNSLFIIQLFNFKKNPTLNEIPAYFCLIYDL